MQFKSYTKDLKKSTELKFGKYNEELKNDSKKHFKKQSRELKTDYTMQGKFLLEEFQKQTKIIAEVQVHQTKKLDATFEMTGKLTEDMSFLKGELRMIRNDLKEKVDRSELVSLNR